MHHDSFVCFQDTVICATWQCHLRVTWQRNTQYAIRNTQYACVICVSYGNAIRNTQYECHLCVIWQRNTQDVWQHHTWDTWQHHTCDEASHACTRTLYILKQCTWHIFLKTPDNACCLVAFNILHSFLFLLLLFWPESKFSSSDIASLNKALLASRPVFC